MGYLELALLHLATVLPAFVLGTWLLVSRKGTPVHRALGKVFMALMLATAAITLFMPAEVGPTLREHFGFLHLLSLLVLFCVPIAYFAAARGDVVTHAANMVGVYAGGTLIAGSFALMPGRLLHGWIVG